MHDNPGSARERILATAGQLFYRDGYRAVGVDTIVAESNVAKMTLYRYFPSKDDLIAAYLEESNAGFWQWFEQALGAPEEPTQDRLLSLFLALEALVASPACQGCPFLNAAVDFPCAEHPGHRAALAHKQTLRTRLSQLAAEAGAREPLLLADQLHLLVDGAMMAARVYGPGNPAAGVAATAATLIKAQIEPAAL